METNGELEDARNYAAEIAQGISHYPHGPGEPCVRCERDGLLAHLRDLIEAGERYGCNSQGWEDAKRRAGF
jgi:hypothetical protein